MTLILTLPVDNAKRMVYDRLEQWLVRAFNGEYLKLADLRPIKESGMIHDS